MDAKNIDQLEKSYLEKIWKFQTSNEFKSVLSDSHKSLLDSYEYIYENYDDKNIIKVAAERIIRFFGYQKLDAINIYSSPLSSDMAIETEDAIVCIDAKTINMLTNSGDDKAIAPGRNQVSFNNKALHSTMVGDGDYEFKGVYFEPHVKTFSNNKPILTFFLTINYEDDHINSSSFKLSHHSLACVPHKYVAREYFDNDLIYNFKTYKYIGKKLAERYGQEYMPRSLTEKKESWLSFKAGNRNLFLDTDLLHPEDNNLQCVWGKIDKKYKVSQKNAYTARIDKKELKNRYLKEDL